MGCAPASKVLYASEPKMMEWKKHFVAIKLDDSDVLKFRELLLKIKSSSKTEPGRSLSIRDLLDYFRADLTAFMYKAFSSYKDNADPNGMVDSLLEFVFSFWNFGTLDESSTGRLIMKYSIGRHSFPFALLFLSNFLVLFISDQTNVSRAH